MLKYYLDKTGKVIKSILFPSSEFVDTEPREGSMNPVTSGGVAGSVAQQSSNIAPDYTKTTYEANSYVMHGGVLYTNPNAIGTAEDWNPAHWTQTTVAEMMAGAGGGYKQVNLTLDVNATKTIPVGQKEEVHAACVMKGTDDVIIQLTQDCTDAVLLFERTNGVAPRSLKVMRGSTQIKCYGSGLITHVYASTYLDSDKVMLTTNIEEGHGVDIPMPPTDISEITLANYGEILSDLTEWSVKSKMTDSGSGTWLFVVKGSYAMCLPE